MSLAERGERGTLGKTVKRQEAESASGRSEATNLAVSTRAGSASCAGMQDAKGGGGGGGGGLDESWGQPKGQLPPIELQQKQGKERERAREKERLKKQGPGAGQASPEKSVLNVAPVGNEAGKEVPLVAREETEFLEQVGEQDMYRDEKFEESQAGSSQARNADPIAPLMASPYQLRFNRTPAARNCPGALTERGHHHVPLCAGLHPGDDEKNPPAPLARRHGARTQCTQKKQKKTHTNRHTSPP